jgi:hypothetical protein
MASVEANSGNQYITQPKRRAENYPRLRTQNSSQHEVHPRNLGCELLRSGWKNALVGPFNTSASIRQRLDSRTAQKLLTTLAPRLISLMAALT